MINTSGANHAYARRSIQRQPDARKPFLDGYDPRAVFARHDPRRPEAVRGDELPSPHQRITRFAVG
ncbi:hypothetical protein [Allochromatium warmingii]|uniref:hypothetical protein n=1 Tax=Allochromatium warmingii TaxID=61595 RepID=UPI000B85214E|nr:hypothetical protein [Allochromatium warmingii]